MPKKGNVCPSRALNDALTLSFFAGTREMCSSSGSTRSVGCQEHPEPEEGQRCPWLFSVFALSSSRAAACGISEIITKNLPFFSWEKTNLWHFSCMTPVLLLAGKQQLLYASLLWNGGVGKFGKLTALPPALRGKGVKCQYLGFSAFWKAQIHRISLPPF